MGLYMHKGTGQLSLKVTNYSPTPNVRLDVSNVASNYEDGLTVEEAPAATMRVASELRAADGTLTTSGDAT